MRILTIGLLCGALAVTGCTRQEVNQYSVITYEEADETGTLLLKTAGNLVPWAAESVACVVYSVLCAATEKFGEHEFFPGWGPRAPKSK
jgi:hypothetical protein